MLKWERIKLKCYGTGDDGRQDVFGDIEMFYNPKRLPQTLRAGCKFMTYLSVFPASRIHVIEKCLGQTVARIRFYVVYQAKTSASASRVPALSLPDKRGSVSIGQVIPIAGSFHKRLRSNSGAQ